MREKKEGEGQEKEQQEGEEEVQLATVLKLSDLKATSCVRLSVSAELRQASATQWSFRSTRLSLLVS